MTPKSIVDETNEKKKQYNETVAAAKRFVHKINANKGLAFRENDKTCLITGSIESDNGLSFVKTQIDMARREAVFYVFSGIRVLPEFKGVILALCKQCEAETLGNPKHLVFEVQSNQIAAKKVLSFRDRALGEDDFYRAIMDCLAFLNFYGDLLCKNATGAYSLGDQVQLYVARKKAELAGELDDEPDVELDDEEDDEPDIELDDEEDDEADPFDGTLSLPEEIVRDIRRRRERMERLKALDLDLSELIESMEKKDDENNTGIVLPPLSELKAENGKKETATPDIFNLIEKADHKNPDEDQDA